MTPCSAALYYVIVNNLLKFAFRLNTIMDSSRVMVLDAGRIRQVTQHSEKSDFPLYEFFFTKNYRDKRILIPSPENSTLRRCCSRTKGPFSTEWWWMRGWLNKQTTLWGVHSVAMFCFVLFCKFCLPIGLLSSCGISTISVEHVKNDLQISRVHDRVDAMRCSALYSPLVSLVSTIYFCHQPQIAWI